MTVRKERGHRRGIRVEDYLLDSFGDFVLCNSGVRRTRIRNVDDYMIFVFRRNASVESNLILSNRTEFFSQTRSGAYQLQSTLRFSALAYVYVTPQVSNCKTNTPSQSRPHWGSIGNHAGMYGVR